MSKVGDLAGKREKPDLVVTHLGIRLEVAQKVLETAHNAGIDPILNPSPSRFLTGATYGNVTHLISNEQEAADLATLEREVAVLLAL